MKGLMSAMKVPWIRYGLSVLLTTNVLSGLNTVAMAVNRTVVIGTELTP